VWEKFTVALTLAGINKVYTVRSGIIPVDEGNRLMGRLRALIDAEEVERTRIRMRKTHEQLAIEGRPQGGRCYGYRYERDDEGRSVRVVNDDEAKVVREIADRLVNGHSATSIAADLNARGVAPPQPMMRDKQTGEKKPRPNPRWHISSVKYVISKPAVAGLRSHHGKITRPDGRPSSPKLAGVKLCALSGPGSSSAQTASSITYAAHINRAPADG
jgi:hypothetical protein